MKLDEQKKQETKMDRRGLDMVSIMGALEYGEIDTDNPSQVRSDLRGGLSGFLNFIADKCYLNELNGASDCLEYSCRVEDVDLYGRVFNCIKDLRSDIEGNVVFVPCEDREGISDKLLLSEGDGPISQDEADRCLSRFKYFLGFFRHMYETDPTSYTINYSMGLYSKCCVLPPGYRLRRVGAEDGPIFDDLLREAFSGFGDREFLNAPYGTWDSLREMIDNDSRCLDVEKSMLEEQMKRLEADKSLNLRRDMLLERLRSKLAGLSISLKSLVMKGIIRSKFLPLELIEAVSEYGVDAFIDCDWEGFEDEVEEGDLIIVPYSRYEEPCMSSSPVGNSLLFLRASEKKGKFDFVEFPHYDKLSPRGLKFGDGKLWEIVPLGMYRAEVGRDFARKSVVLEDGFFKLKSL